MSFGVQLGAAIVGDLDAEIEAGARRVAWASYRAMDDGSADIQSKWRQDFRQSGLANGDKLEKTVRRKVYPNGGLDPAAVIWTTAPKLVQAFEQGAVITVNGKRGALFPNPEVWGGRIQRPRGRGAKSVSTFDVGRRRFGDLQFIATPGRGKLVGVFVAKLDRAGISQGRYRRAGVRAVRKGLVDRVVVFFVLHEPRLPRLLRGQVIRQRVESDFPARFQRDFERYLDQAENGPRLLTFQGNLV